jgi:hypothetical protein
MARVGSLTHVADNLARMNQSKQLCICSQWRYRSYQGRLTRCLWLMRRQYGIIGDGAGFDFDVISFRVSSIILSMKCSFYIRDCHDLL